MYLIELIVNEPLYIIIFIIITVLLKYFIPSYFKKLAEDLATKKNLEDITKIVEDIKLQNDKELEFIKSELSVKTKAQQAIYDDERTAIVEYIFSTIDLYLKHIKIPRAIGSQEGVSQFILNDQEFDKFIIQNQLNLAKLNLFCFKKEILSQGVVLSIILAEMTDLTTEIRYKFYNKYNTLVQLTTINNLDAKDERIVKLTTEINKINDEFNEKIEPFRIKFSNQYNLLRDECKQYLKDKHNIK